MTLLHAFSTRTYNVLLNHAVNTLYIFISILNYHKNMLEAPLPALL